MQDWCFGLEIDLGPEGTRLRRYEMAADRLFRSAWTKLERLRKERGVPLIHRSARVPAPEPAPRPPAPPPPASAPPAPAPRRRPLPDVSRSSLLGDPAASVLDFWVGGPPRPGINPAILPRTRRTRRRAGRRRSDTAGGDPAVPPGVRNHP